MFIPGQPDPSPSLRQALDLLADGEPIEAEAAVTNAAKQAKKEHGSGSHPLARAYADMARFHFRTGNLKRAATEFRHAADSPMPVEASERADRLAFMFGFAACLEAMEKSGEAEKVLRQCAEFARNLHGPATVGYAAALESVAELLLKAEKASEAAQIVDEAFAILWDEGDSAIAALMALRAEAFKAVDRIDDPFAELAELPEEMVLGAVAATIGRSARGNPVRIRFVLADLLRFAERQFGEGHDAVADVLAAIAAHEAALGEAGDLALRTNVTRRAVWSFTKPRVTRGLLESVDLGFEEGGGIHLAPRLAREPEDAEIVELEMVLTQAVEDHYARQRARS